MGQGLEALFGQVLENTYRITRLIGEGGMGAVYEAEHTRLPRKFAIKVLFPHVASNQVAVERFHREALVTSELGHPHIVDVIDFNHTPDGFPYIVMEYLEGEDLEQRMVRVGRMAPPAVNRVLEQTASALEAVHKRDIIHRDLKPQNIFLCEKEGVDDYIKVVDFGISKIRGARQALTQAHMVMGTPYYMSPEQAKGHADNADRRADIFALGAMLYEMLTGILPFQGETPDVVLYQVVHENPPSFEELDLDIQPTVEDVVFTAMAKKPEDRWDNMAEMAEAFANAVERTVIDFMSLDEIEGMEEDRKATDRLEAVEAEDPNQALATGKTEAAVVDPDLALATGKTEAVAADPDLALATGKTEPLNQDALAATEARPAVEAGSDQEPTPHGPIPLLRMGGAAGTAPGMGPDAPAESPTDPAIQPTPSDMIDTKPRPAVEAPVVVDPLGDADMEAPTQLIDTRLVLEQEAALAAQQPEPHETDSLKESTFGSSSGEMEPRQRSSRLGLLVVAALLLLGGALTYGAVHMMSGTDTDRGQGKTRPVAATGKDEPKPVKDEAAAATKDEAAAATKDEATAATKDEATAATKDEPKPVKDEATAASKDEAAASKDEAAAASKDEPKPAKDEPNIKPKPALPRRLTVTTTPSGARVLVNGKRVGTTPLERHKIGADRARLVITRSGYKRVNRTIPAGSAPQTFSLKLEQRPRERALGYLRVATLQNGKPYRAFIFINGKRHGESPLRVSLPAGSHRVEAWRQGIKASTKRVTVTAGKTKLVILKLKGK